LSPNQNDFMFIDEERRRIITFVVITREPPNRASMRNWYRPESATSVAARLRPSDPWLVFSFQLEGDRLSWTVEGNVQAWQRVPWAERPDWLEERLAKDNVKMYEAEKCV
jgi:hypothetical protein